MIIIRINKQKIEYNKENNTNEPVVIVDDGKNIKLAHEVQINGPSKIVYTPNSPVGGGTTCYLVVEDDIDIVLNNK